jgi:CBS domain-containing protein
VLIATAVVAALIALDDPDDETVAPPALTTGSADSIPEGIVAVRPVLTSHLLARPSRDAEIVAIVPEQRIAEVIGRSEDGEWLRLVYPLGSELVGWMPRANIVTAQGDPTGTPIIAADAPGAVGDPVVDPADLLPDLTISDATVLPNGRLSVRIDNIGASPINASVGLEVTGAEGALLGVFTVEDLSLAPGRSATVPTTVEVTSTGVYQIELDRLNEIEESGEFNNSLRKLLAAVR